MILKLTTMQAGLSAEDMEDRLNAFVSSSANYDPSTGVYEGEVGMDIVSARFVDLDQRHRFQIQQHESNAEPKPDEPAIGNVPDALEHLHKSVPTLGSASCVFHA